MVAPGSGRRLKKGILMHLRRLAVVLVGAGLAGPALGQDRLEVAYGLTVTSNYIVDGTTQSDDKPALQGYVEGIYGLFYGGLWASTVDFPGDPDFGDDNMEIDAYLGLRQSLGDVDLDVSYYRYFYDQSGDCCGEFVLKAGYPMADLGAVGLEFDYDPEEGNTWLEGSAGLLLRDRFEVGGAVGTDFGSEEWGDDDKVAWNVGATKGLGELATVDLRYHDSNYDPGRLVLSMSVDF